MQHPPPAQAVAGCSTDNRLSGKIRPPVSSINEEDPGVKAGSKLYCCFQYRAKANRRVSTGRSRAVGAVGPHAHHESNVDSREIKPEKGPLPGREVTDGELHRLGIRGKVGLHRAGWGQIVLLPLQEWRCLVFPLSQLQAGKWGYIFHGYFSTWPSP